MTQIKRILIEIILNKIANFDHSDFNQFNVFNRFAIYKDHTKSFPLKVIN